MAESARAAGAVPDRAELLEAAASYGAPFWTKPEGDEAYGNETRILAQWSRAHPEVLHAVREWFPDCAVIDSGNTDDPAIAEAISAREAVGHRHIQKRTHSSRLALCCSSNIRG